MKGAVLFLLVFAATTVFAQARSTLRFFDSTGTSPVARLGWVGPANSGNLFIETIGDNNGVAVQQGVLSADGFAGSGSALTQIPQSGVVGLPESLTVKARITHAHPDTQVLGSGTAANQYYKWDNSFRRGTWASVTAAAVAAGGVDSNAIAQGAVTSSKVKDGTIRDVDVASDAAIAGTKIVPNFGAANVLTTGRLAAGGDSSQFRLGLCNDGGIFATGTIGSGTTVTDAAVDNASALFMWYPRKAAIRSGQQSAFASGDANMGVASAAFGSQTQAKGPSSFAAGCQQIASGFASIALGFNCTASGQSAVAINNEARASGIRAFAAGSETTAKAYCSSAMGSLNVIEGDSAQWIAAEPLFVVGNGQNATRSNALCLRKNGNMTISGVLTQNSDRRLKTDISVIESCLDKIRQIRGVYYRWNKQAFPNRTFPEGRQVGMIAQEVEVVLPEAVQTDAQGYKSLSYDRLVPVLIEAIKEQQARIESLEKRLEQVEGKPSAQ